MPRGGKKKKSKAKQGAATAAVEDDFDDLPTLERTDATVAGSNKEVAVARSTPTAVAAAASSREVASNSDALALVRHSEAPPPPPPEKAAAYPSELVFSALAQELAEVKDLPEEGRSRKLGQFSGYKNLEKNGLFSDIKGALQRELRERKLLLLAKDGAKTLSLHDVSEHNLFMMAVQSKLFLRREVLTKRARRINVLLNGTKDAGRKRALQQDMGRIKVAEKNFNEDVTVFNTDLLWFHSCPAFHKAQEHVAQKWVNIGNGDRGVYVPRAELEEDEAADNFESMLAKMKLEDSPPPSKVLPL